MPAANEVTGTTVDASNVVVELGKIADAIPASLFGNPELTIFVSQHIFRAYKRALGGFSAQSNEMGNNQDINVQYFDGIKVAMANGLGTNVAIASLKDNLYFGTGLMSDQQEVKVLDMSDLDGSQNVRFIMRYTAAVQYSVVEDIVTYGIVNAAN